MSKSTPSASATEVYRMYYRSALASGTPLSREVFQTIWTAISAREQAVLFKQFQRGSTTLIKEVTDEADDLCQSLERGISEDEIDPDLLREIRDLARKHDFRSH